MDCKTCRKCGLTLPVTEFNKVTRTKSTGLRYRCKACEKAYANAYRKAHPNKARLRNLRYRKRHPDRAKQQAFNKRWKRNGNNPANVQNLIDAHNGHCDICGQKSVRLVVDHCHHTGKLRGILCDKCNFGLGLFKDDPSLLRRAADYL